MIGAGRVTTILPWTRQRSRPARFRSMTCNCRLGVPREKKATVGTALTDGCRSQGQGLLFMEGPWNGGTVDLEGPGLPGKQKARRACARR